MRPRWVVVLLLSVAAFASPRLSLRFETTADGNLLARDGPCELLLARAKTVVTLSGASITTRLAGARTDAGPEGLDPLAARANYLIGGDPAHWRTGAALYARAIYRDVYPFIDLVYHGSGRMLEYDFVVRPGGDPRAIALDLSGASSERLEPDGTLAIATPAGLIRWKKPEIYQERDGAREPVAGRFVLRGHHVTFAIGRYDRARTLVIDPVLAYASYLGGSDDEGARSIAVDTAGNAYVTGYTLSRNLPGTGGFFQPTYRGGSANSFIGGDAFVAKYSKTGALVYVTYLGGTADDVGVAIAVDAGGNAYVTGYTNSTDFPVRPGAFQSTFQGKGNNKFNPVPGGDAFVAKLNPLGTTLVYCTYLGGKDDDKGTAIAVDAAGNAYVGGVTLSTNFPTQNAYQAAFKGFGGIPDLCSNCGPILNFGDAFLSVLNPAGSALVFSTYFGGSLEDTLTALALDSAGNIYIGGSTLSSNFPTQNAYQSKYGGGANTNLQPVISIGDGYVAKFDKTGKLMYSTYLGGSRDDAVMGLAVDSAGAVYVTGFTSSSDFPGVAATVAQPKYHGPAGLTGFKGFLWGDAFVAKLTPAGNGLLYATYLGGSDDDAGMAIAVDAAGNAYVAGFTNSTDFATSADALQKTFGGKSTLEDPTGDAFVAKITPDGAAIPFSTYFGGSLDDAAMGIALDTQGNAYVLASTASANLQVANAAQAKYGGFGEATEALGDAFVLQISGLFPPVAVSSITAVVNAASLDNRLSPGAAATLMGSNLGAASTGALVGGKQAQVVSATASQWNIVIPQDAAVGTTSIQVGASAPFSITLAQYAPALYSANGTVVATHGSGGAVNDANPAAPGENVSLSATGLGAVDSTGATLAQPSVTIGGATANFVSAVLVSNGVYRVTVQVPAVAAGAQPVILSIGGATGNTLTIPVQAAGAAITGVVNAASLQAHGATPGSSVNIQIANLGTPDDSGNIFPATTFEGISILFNGTAAPLTNVYGSTGQVNLVVPADLPTSGTVNVQVVTPLGTSPPFALTMLPDDVGVYRVADPSNPARTNGDVQFANTAGRVMPASMAAALGLPGCDGVDATTPCAQPAKIGDTIVIAATGLNNAMPAVSIGGVPAPLQSSTAVDASPGLYQITVTVPDGVQAGDDVPLVVTMPDGSTDTVTIAIAG